jgi:hypothetical protein
MNTLSTIHSPLSTKKALLLTLGLSAILLFPTVFWPFDYDQGTFAYGGSALLRGEKPYIDFWDIKPPNIFFEYALAFAVFGKSVLALRIYDYLHALLIIGLLFLLATRLWKNTPWRHISAVMASLAYVLQYYIFGHWDTAQAESYSIVFLLTAMLLVIPNRSQDDLRGLALRAALAGACIGLTFYFKFPIVLFIIVIAAALWMHSGHERELHFKALASCLGGFIAVIGLETLYLALKGELIPLYTITTSSTASYVGSNFSGSFSFLQNIRTGFQNLDLLWVVAAILGWGYWAADRHPRAKHTHSVFQSVMLLVMGCIIALIIVQLQNKGYKYHYTVLLPWADLLIGAGIAHVARALASVDTLPRGNNAAIVAVLLFVLSYVWTSSTTLHERTHELGAMAAGTQRPNGYIAGDSLADFVNARTNPADRIFIFGFDPYLYWKTDRTPATRYLNTIHFKPSYVPKEQRDELVRSLVGNPPELFLVELGDRYTSQGNTNDDSRTAIQLRYPELEQLLQTRYWPEDTIQSTIAYRLRH